MSISKYFGSEDRKTIISSLKMNKYRPEHPYTSMNPLHDWIASLDFSGKILCEAAKNENDRQSYSACVNPSTLFVSGSPDCSVEDSLVYNYLSHLLLSVFSKDPCFKIKWANGELKKTDFVVYSIVIKIFVIGEFKKSSNYSTIESDIVKLGKQMRLTFNDLVLKRIPNPVVCGIICQGDEIITYFMDVQSLKHYRMIKMSKIKLFKSLKELYSLFRIISGTVQLKNVALETSKKPELSIIEAAENNHRNPTHPFY